MVGELLYRLSFSTIACFLNLISNVNTVVCNNVYASFCNYFIAERAFYDFKSCIKIYCRKKRIYVPNVKKMMNHTSPCARR